MSLVSTGIGLVSGLNYTALVQALLAPEQAQINTLNSQDQSVKTRDAAVTGLIGSLAPLASSATDFGTASNFSSLTVQNSDPSQLTATTTTGATAGNYQLQSLRLAAAQQTLTRGFANTNQQLVGAGTITISPGGQVATQTTLSVLNGGAGVQRGVIRITDRSGASANVDLSNAYTVDDVLAAINGANGIAVHASVQGGRLVLADVSGQSLTNLSIADVGNAQTAESLGIAGSVASATLTGSNVYQATGAFTLASLNDGNQIRLAQNQPSLQIQLTDSAATKLSVDLTGATTLGDVVKDINNAAGNSGKLTASITNGRLLLTDNTGGGGANALSASDINGASVVHELGLDVSASGNTLTGNQLVAGLDSVLLRNLRGGQGISQPGQVSLTDRTGATATIDLSQAQSLNDVVAAINNATTGGGQKLHLSASVDPAGTGIVVQDTSGSTTSNLVIADIGGGTIASQLGIAVNAAQNSIDSGSLGLQYVNLATSLSTYGSGGTAIPTGAFTITDSTGQKSTVSVTSSGQTIGDLQQAIASATGGKVLLQLNSTGDGFELVDQAGGSGQLTVTDLGGKTASALRIAGTGTAGPGGGSQIASRAGTQIAVADTDTLASLAAKINAANAGVTASIINDGSTFSPNRLLLTSSTSGSKGQFAVDDGGLGLGFATQSQGQDALLKVATSASATPFLLTSSTNHFDSVLPGLNVDLNAVGDAPAQVSVVADASKISDLVSAFATNYNNLAKQLGPLTTYNTATNTPATLQGDGGALRLENALSDLVTNSFSGPAGNKVQSLTDLGITVAQDGTLQLDTTVLSQQLAANPGDVSNFFLDSTNGFASKLKNTVNSFNDSANGELTLESNALEASSTSIETRVAQLNSILADRQQTLMNTFIHLETVLSNLRTQQSALAGLLDLVNPPTSSSGSSASSTSNNNTSNVGSGSSSSSLSPAGATSLAG
jgi:flagellar hook-associated protein 2